MEEYALKLQLLICHINSTQNSTQFSLIREFFFFTEAKCIVVFHRFLLFHQIDTANSEVTTTVKEKTLHFCVAYFVTKKYSREKLRQISLSSLSLSTRLGVVLKAYLKVMQLIFKLKRLAIQQSVKIKSVTVWISDYSFVSLLSTGLHVSRLSAFCFSLFYILIN